MQISLSSINWMTFADPSGPPHAAITPGAFLDAARSAGATHIGWDALTLGSTLDSAESREKVADLSQRSGLVCTDLGVLRIGRGHGLTQAAQLADLAGRLDCPWVNAIIDSPVDAGVIDEARACSEVVRDAGSTLCLEFMAHGPVPTLRAAIDVADRIGWDMCRLLLDSWHLLHSAEDWGTTQILIESLSASQIGLVQVADGKGLAGSTEEFAVKSRVGRRAPGEGDHPLGDVLEAIGRTGFTGTVSAEVLSYAARHAEPTEAARILVESLKRLTAAVTP